MTCLHMLIIEVPESAVAHDIGNSLENLVQLRVKGFGLAIDDYGTGHCAREQLERIPASELKIDRKMLAGAGRRPALRELLETGLEISRELNFKTVAEGVENQEEWDLVNELGCDWPRATSSPGPWPARRCPNGISSGARILSSNGLEEAEEELGSRGVEERPSQFDPPSILALVDL